MSKVCFLILFTLYSRCLIVHSVVNTGTVLFSNNDVNRQCWHPEEIGVLTSRMILQDLLPDVRFLEISDNEYVNDLIDYFRLMFDIIQKSTQGRIRHIMMLALTDLIGGFLQHAVLPMARQAYYAGIVDYYSMEKLIQLYEELRWFLRTNGQGWAGPMLPKTEYEIEPIDVSNEGQKGNKSCCRNLIYYERSPAKRSADKDSSRTIFFPVPFFDSKVRPSAIAVPFRRFALRNIESKRAAYMIMKYYISVHNCLRDLKADKNTIENFQNSLYTWIEKNVIPKLRDDKFYSAFGGILRVQASLKAEGASLSSHVTECYENEGDQELGTVPGGETSSRSGIVLVSMLVIIFIWFIIGTVFICYRIKKNSKKTALSKMATASSASTSSYGSSRWSSSKRTVDTCKCCTTPTDKSVDVNSSLSSEFDKEEEPKTQKREKKEKSKKSLTVIDKSSKRDESYSRMCLCDEPPTIDPKHSMKLLPSIPEISENSSSKREDWKKQGGKSKKISFGQPPDVASKEDVQEPRKSASSKMRVCVPRVNDVDITVCPHYEEKATSLSSYRSKTVSEKELGTQMSEAAVHEMTQEPEFPVITEERGTSNENTTEETTDNTIITANAPHIYACHSSLTGNYTRDQRFRTEKPFIFGYDFQTSSSSELSDEESDARTSTTK